MKDRKDLTAARKALKEPGRRNWNTVKTALKIPTKKPPLISHAERRKLIETPITFHVVGSAASRGGTAISDDDRKARVYTPNTYAWHQIFQAWNSVDSIPGE